MPLDYSMRASIWAHRKDNSLVAVYDVYLDADVISVHYSDSILFQLTADEFLHHFQRVNNVRYPNITHSDGLKKRWRKP